MKTVSFLFLSLLLFSCSGNQRTQETLNEQKETAMAAPPAAERESVADEFKMPASAENPQPAVYEKKVIKEGELTFETLDMTSTKSRITSAIKNSGGYIESESQQSSQYSPKTVTLSIRIPAHRFDAFVQSISAKDDQIVEKNIRVRDVTTQYIDLKTRLRNRMALEKRYLQLLQKAAKVSDVLEIENKLADIRAEVESQQGQLNYMLKQVQYSSLSISFFVKGAAETEPGFAYRLGRSFSESIEVLADVFFGIIRYWPLIVLFLLIIFGWRKYRGKNGMLPPKTKS